MDRVGKEGMRAQDRQVRRKRQCNWKDRWTWGKESQGEERGREAEGGVGRCLGKMENSENH